MPAKFARAKEEIEVMSTSSLAILSTGKVPGDTLLRLPPPKGEVAEGKALKGEAAIAVDLSWHS